MREIHQRQNIQVVNGLLIQFGSLPVSFVTLKGGQHHPTPLPRSSSTVGSVRLTLKTSEKETGFLENQGIENFRQVPNEIFDLVIPFF